MRLIFLLLSIVSVAKAQKLDTSFRKTTTFLKKEVVVRSKIDTADKLCIRGGIFFEMSLYGRGIQLFKVADSLDHNNPFILGSLGFGYMKLRKLDSAIIYLKKATELDKNDKISQKNLIYCYLYKLDYDTSNQMANKYRKKYPDDPESYYTLVLINRKQGLYKKAINNAKKAIALYTNDNSSLLGNAYYMLGLVYREDGQRESSLLYFRKAKAFGGVYVDPKYLE